MTTTPHFITHIRGLIAKNEIATAIKELKALLENSPRLTEVLQQSARYHRIMTDQRLGVVDAAIANLEQNKISWGLLELLDEIAEEYSTKPEVKTEVERYTQKNVLNQSSINAGQNAIIGDGNTINNIIQKPSNTPPRYLTQKPFYTDFFIGREQDLAAIETDYLQQNHLLVLVNGEGGMGKTTLAAQYWFKHENRYKHLAWMFSDNGIGNALLSLANNMGVMFHPHDDVNTQIARIAEGLTNLENPCLLVFDNANNAADLEDYLGVLRRLSNCHILLTSRVTVLEDVSVHRVLPLKEDFAMQLFKKNYPKHSDTEDSLLVALLHAVGYNTLVIELLAKNLAVFNKFGKNYSLTSLLNDLQERGLLALKVKPIKTLYQANSLRTETPDTIIAAMYDVSDLTEIERYLLNNFAVLPAENIQYDIFMHLLKPAQKVQKKEKNIWNKLVSFFQSNKKDISLDLDKIQEALISLQQKGWIDFYEASNDFKISPVIQHITKRKNAVTLLDDCNTLIQTLIEELDYDKIHYDNYKMSAIFTRYAETVVAAFDTPQYNAVLLCERIGRYYTTVGNLDRAIHFYEKYSAISKELCVLQPDDSDNKNALAIAYSKLGETHSALGNLEKALGFYEEYNRLEAALYAAYPNNVGFKNGLAISYSKLGSTHSALGNLEKALGFYEEMNTLFAALYAAYPNNVEFKNGLAIAYEKLGNTHSALGNLDKALGFYEDYNRLEAALYAAYPNNVEFKNNLAISYSKLGETHTALGNLEKALGFYEDDIKLSKELYATYPNNVEFKNGLAISYQFLGDTHSSLGNLDKALGFYEEMNTLFAALYAAYSNNVGFKNGLAISYSNLGETHSKLGNLDKALGFYEDFTKLTKELYAAYPNNVEFKNNLAISYSKLGWFYKDQKKDKIKARFYFEKYLALREELAKDFPSFAEFQRGLQFAKEALKSLEK
jgi:tetratricopeptide (TPR) repeat protein